jgi:hypothetical protein
MAFSNRGQGGRKCGRIEIKIPRREPGGRKTVNEYFELSITKRGLQVKKKQPPILTPETTNG